MNAKAPTARATNPTRNRVGLILRRLALFSIRCCGTMLVLPTLTLARQIRAMVGRYLPRELLVAVPPAPACQRCDPTAKRIVRTERQQRQNSYALGNEPSSGESSPDGFASSSGSRPRSRLNRWTRNGGVI